jgi:pimeloyl-ACP methyl ester carboxylesterase/DNA-binding CsgD family transcriptional regulator
MSQRQVIRYRTTTDGVRIAWAEAGGGPPLVKSSNWLSHLEFDWESPVFRHWVHFFADHFRFIRYDERGCGLTDWDASNLSLERWTDDLEEVINAARIDEPFTLLGISQGGSTCIQYAVRHPKRVARLILYGAYARGAYHREDAAEYKAVVDLVRVGWGKDNPAFRQVFTSRFVPQGTAEQIEWFNDLAKKTTSPNIAAPILEARAHIDVVDLLEQIRVPTLVLHARNDNAVPLAEGKLIAAKIPNAEFVEIDSRNHVLLEHEPAWKRFCNAVLEFTGSPGEQAFASLSQRERQILSLLSEGLSNAAIAAQLLISEKTVRNQLSKIFDKLGVWSRAQAIVFAREHGFK